MPIPDLRVNTDRLRADFDELSEIGATPNGGVNRLALSNEDLQARAWFAGKIDEAGFLVHDDEAGNLSGVLYCSNPTAKTLMLGSHLDSVPNGGKYDGAIGVLSALECLRVFKESGLDLPVHLEAISFTDEEGCWQGLFGSKALTGRLAPFSNVEKESSERAAFRAALYRAGIRPADVHRAKRSPNMIAGYLELHIEQGARLFKGNTSIGVVTGIVGRTTYQITFFGEASHSGTTAPEDRRDALLAASTFISEAHQTLAVDGGIFNCGNIKVMPGAFNVIPERAMLIVECRHPDERRLSQMEGEMVRLAQDCALKHNTTVSARHVLHMPAAKMSEMVMTSVEQACQSLNITSHTRLVSYAGHDAQMMSSITPSGMIFIPSYQGISHNPKEHSEWSDVVQGANVLLQAALRMAGIC
jgi:beta-ureidopropionase / N-carbamoyl-L-amino-acid hydrolase